MKQNRAKTPTVLQMEAAECGAAALGIILGYYKRFVPLDQLRVLCGVSRDGSNVLNMKKAAEKFGMQMRVFRKNVEEVKNLPGPFIVFWDYNHFLVVEGFKNNTVFINDPARGPYKLTFEEFAIHYSGIVITLEKTENFKPGGTSPSPWPGIYERIRNVKAPFIFLMTTGFGIMLAMAIIPTFKKVFFDVILGQKIFDWSFWFMVGFTILVILVLLFSVAQGIALIRINGKLSVKYSAQYLWHILRLPLTFYQQRFGGEIAQRVSLNDDVINDITGRLASVFVNIFFIIFYAALMLWFSMPIAIVGIIAATINLFAMFYTQKARTDSYMYLQQSSGKYFGFAVDGLNNMETIKSIGGEHHFFKRLMGYFSQLANTEQQLGQKNSYLTALPVLLDNLTSAALFGVGGYLFITVDFTLGLFMAIQALLNNFMSPVGQLLDLGNVLQMVQTNISRIDDVLKNPIDPLFESAALIDTEHTLEGHLELRDVTFGYSPMAPPLIENFNLELKPGHKVALVGPTGCGKTTIARLINGLVQPWSGEILFDGKKRSQMSHEHITESLATIDQDIFLFAGTIKDNITLFDPYIPDADVIEAAKDAVIHHEILEKPHGYQYKLEENGSNLSGGQRQRLEIARGLLLKPSILILDEATSALDSSNEEKIIKQLKARNCSVIMIAHRLSTIRDCDEIIVLDQGKVVQRGTHTELVQEPGIYKDFVLKDIDA